MPSALPSSSPAGGRWKCSAGTGCRPGSSAMTGPSSPSTDGRPNLETGRAKHSAAEDLSFSNRLARAQLGEVPNRWAKEVPSVAADVDEHRATAVDLIPRIANKGHIGGLHPPENGVKIIDAEEETHPSSHLTPDYALLSGAVRLRQEEPRGRVRRADDYPA